MKLHQELHIRVDPESQADFLDALQNVLPSDWHRDIDSERRSPNLTGRLVAYYRCDESPTRPSAMLAMYKKKPNVIYVSNIVPMLRSDSLSRSKYNAILMDFHDRVLRKLETAFPITVIVASDQCV